MGENILIHKDMKKLMTVMEILITCLIREKFIGINMRGKKIEIM
jgi:hypothetical protein